MSNSSRHAIVLGAGVFGVAAALELAARGWRVDVVDRFDGGRPAPHPRASSTDVSKVIRADYGADRGMTRMALDAMCAWEEWNLRFPRPLFHRTGFLLLAGRPMAEGGFEAESWRVLSEHGAPLERIRPDDFARRFPAWRDGRYPDGYLNRAAGWAESGAVVAAMIGWAREAGVEFVDGEAELLAERSSGPSLRVRTSAGTRESTPDLVVIAAGAWTSRLMPELRSEVEARAMPVVHIRPRDPGPFAPAHFPVWGADISGTGWYGFPLHRDGWVKIGHHGRGWADDPDSADTLPPGFEERLRGFLADSLPGLADGDIVHRRVCFYADSRDGDFWIARVPDRPGVVVAAGGSGHGFKFAPVLGSLISDAAEGVSNERLDRFGWRPGSTARREDARSETEIHEPPTA